MKLGCAGCLILIVLLVFLAAVVGAFFVLSGNMFQEPRFEVLDWSRADVAATRSKLYEIAQRDAGQSGRQDPIILTEREVNAWLVRHLAETAGLRFDPFAVTLTEFNLGKQPVGSWPFSVVMGPAGLGLLSWPVPGVVRDIDIADRRVVIETR